MSRARNQPDAALLTRAIDHVRRAIELADDLAEAHATLAFLLVSANRVDTLRRLVAAGQYHVSPKYLAMKIFKAAGLEE